MPEPPGKAGLHGIVAEAAVAEAVVAAEYNYIVVQAAPFVAVHIAALLAVARKQAPAGIAGQPVPAGL